MIIGEEILGEMLLLLDRRGGVLPYGCESLRSVQVPPGYTEKGDGLTYIAGLFYASQETTPDQLFCCEKFVNSLSPNMANHCDFTTNLEPSERFHSIFIWEISGHMYIF